MLRRLGMGVVGAAMLAMPVLTSAQTAVGTFADGCATPVDNHPAGAELYAVKISPAGNTYTNWLWDVSTKGATAPVFDGVDAGGQTYNIPPNWVGGAPGGTDIVFVYMTYANGMIGIDSGNVIATNGAFLASLRQHVGDSIAGSINGTPTGGINLTLSSAAAGTTINTGGATALTYPKGTNTGIEVAFGALAEINNLDVVGGAGCTVAGENPNPETSRGGIIGYNVYRMPDASGGGSTPPTTAQIGTVQNFQYFIPYTSFDFTQGDPGGAGSPAPGDSIPLADLAGLQNRDRLAHSGDEIIVFQDSATNPNGSGRVSGSGPVLSPATGYWYAFQPVAVGCVNCANTANAQSIWAANNDAGASAKCLAINCLFGGDHRMDLDGDTVMESINLDRDTANSPEFISPQAKFNQPGLGLTHGGLPLLSVPVYGIANPAAAMGQITLSATQAGATVNISFSTAIEAGNVQGFNVYRVMGDNRVRVNQETILARGGEGNVYTLLDDAVRTTTRRATRGTVQYMVEVIYNDGTASRTVGPFSLSADRESSRRR